MEIERKWLIDKNNIPYDLSKVEYWNIEQAYISFSPVIRIRKIDNKNLYVLTIKSSSKDNGLSREEYELNISKEQYNCLLSKKEGNALSKTRYRVLEGKYTLEIDVFHKELDGFAYMEVEFDNVEEAKAYNPPSFIIKELTGDKRYTNAALARGIVPDLSKEMVK